MAAACAFPGCGRKHYGNGLCKAHAQQRWRGEPLRSLRLRASTLEARLLGQIEPDTSQWGCWLWTGSLTTHGYGDLRFDGEHLTAHRAAFRTWVGPIPPDRPHVLHHCDTTACIRPDHLWAGTHDDNMADMSRKGRGRGRYSQPLRRDR